MKIKDLIAAVRDYPALRQALEESNTELDLSRMECAQLQSKINELEPLVDEYYQESCGKEYAANQERQKVETLKKALASFCPALDSTEQLRRFYDTIAPDFDDGGFRLYDAALAISGYPNLPGEFPYEDNRGVFDEADGHQLLKYLTALHFHAVRWEAVPGTPYPHGQICFKAVPKSRIRFPGGTVPHRRGYAPGRRYFAHPCQYGIGWDAASPERPL